jgi:hypothetical protein
MMAIRDPCRETCTVTSSEDLFTSVGNQNDLALDDPDELVLVSVPVALARPGVRRKMQQIDAELGQAGRIAESAARAGASRFVVGRRVSSGSLAPRDCGHLDLRHQQTRCQSRRQAAPGLSVP